MPREDSLRSCKGGYFGLFIPKRALCFTHDKEPLTGRYVISKGPLLSTPGKLLFTKIVSNVRIISKDFGNNILLETH